MQMMKNNQYIFPGLLFFAAVVLITLLIPTGGHYMQRFNMGDRWRGETLTAPFDFSISKSEAEIAADRRKAERNYIPVYTLDTAVGTTQITAAQEAFTDRPAAFNGELARALAFVYGKGVVGNVEHSSTGDGEMSYIRIDNNSMLETVSTKEVFTMATGVEYLKRQMAGFMKTGENDFARFIVPNLSYNEVLNAALRDSERKNIAATKGIVYENELIVSHNQIISQEVFSKLNSLKKEYETRIGDGDSFGWVLAGHFLIVFTLLSITFLFFYFFRNDIITKRNNIYFILSLFFLMTALSSSIAQSENLSIYLIPFAIVPIYILTFYDVRMSIFEHSVVLLLCSVIVPKPFEFFFINFVAGIVGVFMLRRAYRRDRIFRATGAIFLSNCVCYTAMHLIQYGGLLDFEPWIFVWFLVNAILFLGMYQLLYVIEKLFGFTSDVSLLELCDTNQKLLQELAHKAPGTFQHTLQVANLAEAAAKEIGARPLLARTGALYHDIGKMNNPAYFIENTNGSAFNPHNYLNPLQSAEIIRKHVTDGVALARKEGLPAIIIDFITGHHGDSLIYYFYSKQKEQDGGVLPDKEKFQYPGPKPISKEVSICMMADAVEAASRSLSDYTEEAVSELVDKIVDIQINEGELSNSALSFHEIAVVKGVFKNKLANMYHTRISYPERE